MQISIRRCNILRASRFFLLLSRYRSAMSASCSELQNLNVSFSAALLPHRIQQLPAIKPANRKSLRTLDCQLRSHASTIYLCPSFSAQQVYDMSSLPPSAVLAPSLDLTFDSTLGAVLIGNYIFIHVTNHVDCPQENPLPRCMSKARYF